MRCLYCLETGIGDYYPGAKYCKGNQSSLGREGWITPDEMSIPTCQLYILSQKIVTPEGIIYYYAREVGLAT